MGKKKTLSIEQAKKYARDVQEITFTDRRKKLTIDIPNKVTVELDNLSDFKLSDPNMPAYFKGNTKEHYLNETVEDFLSDISEGKSCLLTKVPIPAFAAEMRTYILPRQKSLFTNKIIEEIHRENIKTRNGNNFFKELVLSGYAPAQIIEELKPSTGKLLMILYRLCTLNITFQTPTIFELLDIMDIPYKSRRLLYNYLKDLEDEGKLEYKFSGTKPSRLIFTLKYDVRNFFYVKRNKKATANK